MCKHDGPCTTLLAAVDPAGMSAFVRIVQNKMWVFVCQSFLNLAAGRWPNAQALHTWAGKSCTFMTCAHAPNMPLGQTLFPHSWLYCLTICVGCIGQSGHWLFGCAYNTASLAFTPWHLPAHVSYTPAQCSMSNIKSCAGGFSIDLGLHKNNWWRRALVILSKLYLWCFEFIITFIVCTSIRCNAFWRVCYSDIVADNAMMLLASLASSWFITIEKS